MASFGVSRGAFRGGRGPSVDAKKPLWQKDRVAFALAAMEAGFRPEVNF